MERTSLKRAIAASRASLALVLSLALGLCGPGSALAAGNVSRSIVPGRGAALPASVQPSATADLADSLAPGAPLLSLGPAVELSAPAALPLAAPYLETSVAAVEGAASAPERRSEAAPAQAPPSALRPPSLVASDAPAPASRAAPTGPRGALEGLDGGIRRAGAGALPGLLNSAWDGSREVPEQTAPVPGAELPQAAPPEERFEVHAEHHEGRAAALFEGVSANMPATAQGQLVFWSPDDRARVRDPYLATPWDSRELTSAKIGNERAFLRTAWSEVLAALEAAGRITPWQKGRARRLVMAAEGRVARQGLRAEAALEATLAKRSGGEAVSELLRAELLAALLNRSALVHPDHAAPELEWAEFHRALRAEQERAALVRLYSRVLRLPYGLEDHDAKAIAGQRSIASARRMIIQGLLANLLGPIEKGQPARAGFGAAIAGIRRMLEAQQKALAKSPGNIVLRDLVTVLRETLATFEAARAELDVYDFVYLPDDAESARAQKRAHAALTHERLMRGLRALAADGRTKDLLARFDAFATGAIARDGRPPLSAAAEFLAREGPALEEANTAANDAGGEGPLDLLMRYAHLEQAGEHEEQPTRPLVIFAERIGDETDFTDLLLRHRGLGRVVAIVTPEEAGESEGRFPHWVIWAKSKGIVPIPWAALGDDTWTSLRARYKTDHRRPYVALADGKRGQLALDPTSRQLAAWAKRGEAYGRLESHYLETAGLPAAFAGRPLRVLLDEADPAAFAGEARRSPIAQSGAYGVGLLRMEQLMLQLGPESEEDGEALREALEAVLRQPFFAEGAPIAVRLFDFEGDKRPRFLTRERPKDVSELLRTHSNARFYLDPAEPRLRGFGKLQLEALFHAGLDAPSRLEIFFSNVRSPAEAAAIEALAAEAAEELAAKLAPGDAAAQRGLRERALGIPLGYMIEDVDSVARLESIVAGIQAARAGRPAFLSVGTNDLQKSILRDDPRRAEKLAKLHPKMVHDLAVILRAARRHGLEVKIDGEWGSSPKLLFALLALQQLEDADFVMVPYRASAPRLLGMARAATPDDLRARLSGERSLLEIVDGLRRDESSATLAELDRAATALAHQVEDRVVSSLP